MLYLILALCACFIAMGSVRVIRWQRKQAEAEKIRRSLLTPEEREQEDYEAWYRNQW